ncbi:hypothetical protein I302_100844 [Kwoniella bestiolae CBS 10118]|uniref:Histone-lysine N-methyltransferase ASH1L n=1 Tax=Kwoniella bestiolae CBS 10118 TaxID=1296100 RepID=A0A1B9G6A5_9TREE|nr:hypothetical protein I302_04217 [Kwoniella bestiolae CBS 10118]OCF26531.1 hypothetical protein I302_04217 [Kwoniella bestiolae CBS 10118]
MAPVKPLDQKKKRTFFKSKIDIALPSIAAAVDSGSKKKKRSTVAVVGAPIPNPSKKTRSTGDKPTKDVVIQSEGEKQKKKDMVYKKVKVYTSRSKNKAQAIVQRSTRTRSVEKSKASAVGRPPKTARIAVSTKSAKVLEDDTSRMKYKEKDKENGVLVQAKTVKTIPGTKTKSRVVVRTTRSKATPAVQKKAITKTKTIATAATSRMIKSTRDILSKRILSQYKTIPTSSKRTSISKSNLHEETAIPLETTNKEKKDTSSGKPLKKEYMTAGFYCQNSHPPVSKQLHNSILATRKAENKILKMKKPVMQRSTRNADHLAKTKAPVVPVQETISFPPLPYDHGYELFFNTEHEFVLPYNIMKDKLDGKLDGRKKPMPFSKITRNIYPERQKYQTDFTAICRCSPESKCADQCINRLMSYLCGKDCPAGDECTNKTLRKRVGASYKVVHTGSRGFGIVLTQDVKEGDFVMDYRGEVITMDIFMDRIQDEYKGTKNFYALAYDQDEVIDAGMKGNDARFINHGCAPNLEVKKFQMAGDGLEEYEVGMWAIKDIKAGEELFYDYNFDAFGVAAQSDELRTKCFCGAPNCIGFLGRKAGEKTAKGLAAELAIKAKTLSASGNAKKTLKKIMRKSLPVGNSGALQRGTSVLGLLERTPSIVSDSERNSTGSSTNLKTPSESSVGLINEIIIPPVSATSSAEGVLKDLDKTSKKNKRKSEVLASGSVPVLEAKKRSRKSEPAPALVPLVIEAEAEVGLKRKRGRPRKSEPLSNPLTTSTPLRTLPAPESRIKAKKARKSEPVPAPVPSPPTKHTNPTLKKNATPTPKRKARKSESVLSSQIDNQLFTLETEPKMNPRISMDEVREAARIKKAEVVRARRGAPKGWVLLPLGAVPTRQERVVEGGRRPPRDRSSLG